jgi:DNA-3-methyladenine glycosylase
MHHCLNVVTEPAGHGSAVLIRALEPLRNISGKTGGPGLLCKALGVDRTLNGADLLDDRLYIADPGAAQFRIVRRPRIGVDYAGSWARRLLRFYIRGNDHVSRP